MSAFRRWKYVYLAYFSQPPGDRALYRLVREHKPLRIVEVGVEMSRRTPRLIELAQQCAAEPVRYTGIDLFDARQSPAPPLPMKDAYRLLKPLGAQVRLLPGNANQGLAMGANSLPETDLLLISADQDEASLESAWFYVPRMLHAGSKILRQVASPRGGLQWAEISTLEIQRLASTSGKRRAAA